MSLSRCRPRPPTTSTSASEMLALGGTGCTLTQLALEAATPLGIARTTILPLSCSLRTGVSITL